jgi:hypothetical protein
MSNSNIWGRIRSWFLQHKIIGGVIAALLLVGISVGLTILARLPYGGVSSYDRSVLNRSKAAAPGQTMVSAESSPGPRQPSGGAYVEVKEASARVESEDARKDFKRLQKMVESYRGYIENEDRNASRNWFEISTTVRIPADSFDSFITNIKNKFKPETFDARNFRISIQRHLDEMEIYSRTLQNFEKIRDQLQDMELKAEKLDLLMDLSQKETDIARKLKRQKRQLAAQEQKSKYATVQISFEQRRISIMPTELGLKFKRKLSRNLDELVEICMDTVTFGVVLLFKIIQWLIYLALALIPLYGAVRLVIWLYKKSG